MQTTTLAMHVFRHAFDDGSMLLSLGDRLFRLYEGPQSVAFAYRKSRSHRRPRRPRPLSPEDAARLIRLVRDVETLAAHWATDPEARHDLD